MEKIEKPCRVLIKGGCGEITEKKSRFIAHIKTAHSEEEAVAFIDEIKKKYWDARHNCSAFVIGEKGQITRCSDDGEPSGTAGRPMLETLLGENLCNVVVVVTRYFGGTLLGTGGLVRAYIGAVKEGLKDCQFGVIKSGVLLEIKTDYNGIGKIQYIIGQREIEVLETEYAQDVTLLVRVSKEMTESFKKEVTEVTLGKGIMKVLEEVNYIDKEN